ncbi:hypothetical protein OHT68_01570 [Streptomyces canus]|uniref:hypothetical protein n=1 Tax=Streptomyces canus TaxID=58343 RepID=UPI002E2B4A3B|nr:hypothetical protein [Streptomyces canus]
MTLQRGELNETAVPLLTDYTKRSCSGLCRKKRVRQEFARLQEEAQRAQAALGEAEHELQRLVDARVTVTEVLAGPPSMATAKSGHPGRC